MTAFWHCSRQNRTGNWLYPFCQLNVTFQVPMAISSITLSSSQSRKTAGRRVPGHAERMTQEEATLQNDYTHIITFFFFLLVFRILQRLIQKVFFKIESYYSVSETVQSNVFIQTQRCFQNVVFFVFKAFEMSITAHALTAF